MKKSALFTFLCSMLLTLHAGSLRGTVTLGDEKAKISGVLVQIQETKARVVTDANGTFIFPTITNGIYTLEFSQLGYKKTILRVTVDVEQSNSAIDVNLKESPFLLNEVVVTGSLNKHLLKDSPVITEVINRKDIERTGSADVSDVIKAQTGVELGSSIGQTQNVRLQGLNKNQVLILVDGERVTGRVDDAVDLGQIPVNMIEKIEVVKGPLSSTYGSDALGGVVNIITKNPKNAAMVHSSVIGGSNGRQDYEVSGAHTLEGLFGDGWNLSLLVNGGWNVYWGISHYDTSFSYDGVPEYDRKNADIKINLSDSKLFQWDLKYGYYTDEMAWQASSIDYYQVKTFATNDKWTLSSSGNWSMSDNSNLKVSFHFSKNNHGSYKVSNTNFHTDNNVSVEELKTYRTQYTFSPYESSILTVGMEGNVEENTSGRLKNGHRKITNDVGYLEDEWSLWNYTLSFGGRYSDNSVFGGFFAPRVSLRCKVTEKMTIRGSYGRGYRAPSFIELFFAFDHAGLNYMVEGNPNLRPETSHGFNLGIDYARDDLIWFRANFYYNDVTNLIEDYLKQQATQATPYSIFSYENISAAVTKGVDIDVDMAPFQHCALSIGYNYTSAVDGKGVELPFRTPHSVNVKTSYDNPESGTMVSLRARWYDMKIVNDRRQNNNTLTGEVLESVITTPAYHIIDLSATQSLAYGFETTAGINNILGKTVFPYGNARGREFFAGVRYQLP